MSIETKEIITDKVDATSKKIILLPQNYLSGDDHQYHSTTLSFYKYSKDHLDIEYLSKPEILVEQRSGEWFGPALLLTSFVINENPQLASIMCSVIENYVTEFFKGQKKPKIKLKVIYKENKSSKVTEISYEGDIEGLGKLESSILEVAKKGKGSE